MPTLLPWPTGQLKLALFSATSPQSGTTTTRRICRSAFIWAHRTRDTERRLTGRDERAQIGASAVSCRPLVRATELRQRRSVSASTSSRRRIDSVPLPVWPESSTTISLEPVQASCNAYAMSTGQLRSSPP